MASPPLDDPSEADVEPAPTDGTGDGKESGRGSLSESADQAGLESGISDTSESEENRSGATDGDGDGDGSDDLSAVDNDLSEDTIYSVVSDRRRRNTIHYLKQRGEQASVSELAEQLAAWENNKSPDDLTSQERKRVYISLYQSHLPSLDKAGVIDYDDDRGMVSLSDAVKQRRIYLEVVPKNDIPWNLYYVGLTAAGGLLITLAWLNVYPFGIVPDLVWAAVLLVMFGLSAFVQTYVTRRREIGDAGPPPDYLSD